MLAANFRSFNSKCPRLRAPTEAAASCSSTCQMVGWAHGPGKGWPTTFNCTNDKHGLDSEGPQSRTGSASLRRSMARELVEVFNTFMNFTAGLISFCVPGLVCTLLGHLAGKAASNCSWALFAIRLFWFQKMNGKKEKTTITSQPLNSFTSSDPHHNNMDILPDIFSNIHPGMFLMI